jgi:hypothetical protein
MNPAPTPVPDAWRSSPPHLLVLGEGAYARALAQVLAAACIRPDEIAAEPAPNEVGGYTKVLGSLERVILVAGAGDTAADLLRWHEAVWQWIEKLSPEGDQHDVAILFVLADASGSSLADGLALGLGLEKIDPATTGHGIARMSDSLETLCTTLAAIRPMDLPPLRARRAANERHQALEMLKHAASLNEPATLRVAAERVQVAFTGQEYNLDLFCRPPSHRNGNLLRGWLNRIVTGGVTPYDAGESVVGPLEWLTEAKKPK